MFKNVKIPTLELMEGDIPNAYVCMWIDLLLDKKTY